MPGARDPGALSLSALRWRARAPRVAVCVTAVVLSTAGLRSVLDVRSTAAVPARSSPVSNASASPAEGVAELFARAYLSGGDDQARAMTLQRLGFVDVPTASDRPGSSRTSVDWTTVLDATAPGRDAREVQVAAVSGEVMTVLDIIVRRDARGRWGVPQPPAVVGGPAPVRDRVAPPELEVEDKALVTTAGRFLRHYLAAESEDLAADLIAGATVTPPRTDLRVKAIEAVTWIRQPRLIAVAITARSSSGRQLALRYELPVVRASGRWLVAGVGNSPQPDREVTP